MNYTPWTASEDQFIVDNLASLSRGEIATRLGRSRKSVYSRMDRLRDNAILPPDPNNRGRKPKPVEGEKQKMGEVDASLDPVLLSMIKADLTDQQWTLIADNHKIMPRRELARLIGISKLQLNHALMSRGYEGASKA